MSVKIDQKLGSELLESSGDVLKIFMLNYVMYEEYEKEILDLIIAMRKLHHKIGMTEEFWKIIENVNIR